MCRWIAYTGKPIYLDTLVTKPDHSLVVQSRHSQMNYTNSGQLLSTNGDGFGIGWYDKRASPGLFKDDLPAWHNTNLNNLCHQVKSHTFMAHIRATTTGDIQRTNCHPFSYKNWLFQHNGHVSNFPKLRRQLQLKIAPKLYPHLQGTTDSETFFLLALTYGLQENPKAAMQKMVAEVLQTLKQIDKQGVLNLSCAISDGNKLYTVRYSHNEAPMTQFVSTDASCLEEFDDSKPQIPSGSTIVVSEPLDHVSDKWTTIDSNTFTTIYRSNIKTERFTEH
ncbi:glutamine amidotransferase [Rheinheimera pacifica]|jgi:predicted glutamine amidotransferase|uniref:class II glutamine amidotransferase n=1 Tax=Rheinheimera pacifica TaxID=173990 RepID=UPI002168A73D|nr:class II glutamine amidotransferase [Rheinheimera pacifica]MCS4308541.1 glutamine amidotransferase [Rheinheimera pacifica]